MGLQETATYQVEVTLSNEAGELPSDGEVEQLVIGQMGGELNELTGLKCVAVNLTKNLTTGAQYGDSSDV